MTIASVLSAAAKLVLASLRHPNTDKKIVVHANRHVEVVPADTPDSRHAQATARP